MAALLPLAIALHAKGLTEREIPATNRHVCECIWAGAIGNVMEMHTSQGLAIEVTSFADT